MRSLPRRQAKFFFLFSLGFLLLFVFSIQSTVAATTYQVNVGGQIQGVPYAHGVVWFNGYDPGTIVIHPDDTVEWTAVGGVHTVTSTAVNSTGGFVFDSSPKYTPAGALADMGPGKLLSPGSVYELNTTALALGTYAYFCKIHPGMVGNLTITSGRVIQPIVNVVAGFGDTQFAQQAFVPSSLSVSQGTIVRWTLLNPTEPHTITGVSPAGKLAWDSSPALNPAGPPVMVPGTNSSTFSYTFHDPRTYTYFCKVHAYMIGNSWAGMVGTIEVVPLTATDVINSLSSISYASLGLSVLALAVALYSFYLRK